jgi:splicing factor 3A subunit 3
MEEARAALEDCEAFERAACDVLAQRRRARGGGSATARLNADFRVAALIGEGLVAAERAAAGPSGERAAAEAERLGMLAEPLEAFYAERARLQEHFARYPPASTSRDVKDACLERCTQLPVWSGEERHGRYLDLHTQYNELLNLPTGDAPAGQARGKAKAPESAVGATVTAAGAGTTTVVSVAGSTVAASGAAVATAATVAAAPPSYVEYLRRVGDLSAVPLRTKASAAYTAYLESLCSYLEGFARRAMALVPIDDATLLGDFEARWAAGKVAGWERPALPAAAPVSAAALLEAAGAPALTQWLLAGGWKTGGTPLQRAERVLLARAEPPAGGDAAWAAQALKARLFDAKHVATLEARAQALAERLGDVVEATRQFVTRKQTLTHEEAAREEEEERMRAEGLLDVSDESDDGGKSEGEDEPSSDNKLGLPLDYDGKPIPLWLYKLHGLGVEYKCEICGDHSYWGRRAYDRHFQEWRHANGMRLLDIPNTKHFHDVTGIQAARELYSKLQSRLNEQGLTQRSRDDLEQVEDAQGNVYSKKTYLDLQRQGLV